MHYLSHGDKIEVETRLVPTVLCLKDKESKVLETNILQFDPGNYKFARFDGSTPEIVFKKISNVSHFHLIKLNQPFIEFEKTCLGIVVDRPYQVTLKSIDEFDFTCKCLIGGIILIAMSLKFTKVVLKNLASAVAKIVIASARYLIIHLLPRGNSGIVIVLVFWSLIFVSGITFLQFYGLCYMTTLGYWKGMFLFAGAMTVAIWPLKYPKIQQTKQQTRKTR